MCVKAFNKSDLVVKQYVYSLYLTFILDQKFAYSGFTTIYNLIGNRQVWIYQMLPQ